MKQRPLNIYTTPKLIDEEEYPPVVNRARDLVIRSDPRKNPLRRLADAYRRLVGKPTDPALDLIRDARF